MENLPFIKFKNLYVIPTFHFRIEFAKFVKEAFYKIYPDIIAVELPGNIKEEVIEAVDRLPYLSLIGYADTLQSKKLNFIPIDPGDSIIEAIRIGHEHDIEVEFIDFSVKEYQPESLILPDDYALNKVDFQEFYNIVYHNFKREIKKKKEKLRESIKFKEYILNEEEREYDNIEIDILREQYMASYLLEIMPMYHRIVFICGMAHWEGIKFYLENPFLVSDVDINIIPQKYVKIYNIRGSDARFLLKELPYHTNKWLSFRSDLAKTIFNGINTPEELDNLIGNFDKNKHIEEILLKSKERYQKEFKEFIDLHKLKTLFQYTRNLAIIEDRLLPNLFHLISASKNVVDDDYAWKVLETATYYPYDDKSENYDSLKLTGEAGYDPDGRYIKLRRSQPYYSQEHKEIPLDKKPKEKYPGEWRDEWEEGKWNIVSYPPEDKLEEEYFAFIRKKAIKNLQDQRINIEEFKSSIKDGIAIKETIREWGIKQKIYVKNEQQIQGKVDTLIVIFDEDENDPEKYPYKLTWWAEHDKESNMAFYATNPGEYLIGPGISHVEVGGLLSIYPPIYITQVFESYSDYLYKDVRNKAERLLKTGILYSREKHIVYVAEKPPRKYFYSLAGVKHRNLVYIPLDHFSQESLKTIKHIHILAGKNKRKIAPKYIFLDK
ncbi:MAG: hypothetical protein ACQERB_04700 [Promethearchaeati archaeon]